MIKKSEFDEEIVSISRNGTKEGKMNFERAAGARYRSQGNRIDFEIGVYLYVDVVG